MTNFKTKYKMYSMKIKYFTILFVIAIFAISCQSTPVEQQIEVVDSEPHAAAQPTNEQEEEISEPVEVKDPVKSEYERSIENLQGTVTEEEFNADKEAVLGIIAELDAAMNERDYTVWLNYLTPTSKRYWSNQQNLNVLNIKLAGRSTRIRNLPDYFLYFFIPSREGVSVDEIRYLSETVIKVVHIDGETELVYYTFEKIDGKWLLSLDTNI